MAVNEKLPSDARDETTDDDLDDDTYDDKELPSNCDKINTILSSFIVSIMIGMPVIAIIVSSL